MEIIRNGVSYTLTEAEIEDAYALQLFRKMKRDIYNGIRGSDYSLDDPDVNECAVRALREIDSDELLQDLYWRDIKIAIDDVYAEKEEMA